MRDALLEAGRASLVVVTFGRTPVTGSIAEPGRDTQDERWQHAASSAGEASLLAPAKATISTCSQRFLHDRDRTISGFGGRPVRVNPPVGISKELTASASSTWRARSSPIGRR
jgi:hypothetical protein